MTNAITLFKYLLLFSLLFFTACKKNDIQSYRIPKEAPPVFEMASSGAHHDHLDWDAPKHWHEKPASGMRLATYIIPDKEGDGEVSIVSISGPAGGLLSNLNRWRGQLQLPPVTQNELANYHREETIGKHNFHMFKLPGMRVAMFNFKEHNYFFKLTGSSKLVLKNTPELKELLKSVSVK
jgi:hypothetical protein